MHRLALIACLIATPALAEDAKPAPCNPSDPKSVCHLDLTVSAIATIYGAFEKADLKHETWGPVQADMNDQIAAQQPKPKH